ncbi:TetR/AcrR family transcriptional regulator [Gryllotalpicola daejeonensis]|uniref:TetR/AcrR family transcriptional regulator n=1 Tax=Gryllotalpicola daejeonensis TaxID=993087 RepID=A0ABP7ZK41_9MICO
MTTHDNAAASRRTGGYANGRARRQQILDAAMNLFGDVGYRSASLREIAARVGISHPGLLHHFPTKEALLLAVLERRDEIDTATLQEDSDDGVELLRRVIDIVALNTHRRGVVELYTALAAEATSATHPAHDYFTQRYRHTLAAVTRAYRLTHEQGHLRDGISPAAAAAQLVAVMDGLQLQWLLDGGRTDMTGVVREFIAAQLTVAL